MAQLHAGAFAPERGWHAAEFQELLAQPHTHALCAPAGFAISRTLAGESELLTLAVDPAHQGKGVGRGLVAAWLDETDAEIAFLEVAADNAAALAIYRRAGFTVIGKRKGYYARPDTAPVDAITMKCTLTRGKTL